jgi:hypothetical protein
MTGGKQHKGWNTNKGAQWNKYTNGGNGNKGRTYVRDNNNVIYNNANKGNKYNIGKSYDTVHKYVTNNRVKTEGRVNNVYKKYTYTGSETYKGKKDNKWNNIRSKYDKGPSYNKGNKDTHGTQPLNINTATENVKAKDKDATGDINTQWHVQRIESTLGFFDAKSGSDLHDIFYPTEILHRSIPKIRTMQNVFTDDVFLKRWYRASSGYRHVTHLPLRQRYRLTAYSDVGKVARPLWFDTTSLNERMNNYGIYKKHFFETKEGNNYLYYLRYGDYHRYSGRSKALTERNRLLYTGQLARSQIPFRQSSVFRTLPSFLSMFVRISYITKIKFEEFVSANDNADEDIYFKSVYRRFKSFRRAIISFKCFKKTANVPDRLVLVNPHSSLSQLRDFTGIYLPIISISDTATDPFRITYPIPSNDDSLIPLLFYFAIFPNACDAGITNRYIQFY